MRKFTSIALLSFCVISILSGAVLAKTYSSIHEFIGSLYNPLGVVPTVFFGARIEKWTFKFELADYGGLFGFGHANKNPVAVGFIIFDYQCRISLSGGINFYGQENNVLPYLEADLTSPSQFWAQFDANLKYFINEPIGKGNYYWPTMGVRFEW